jgi:molybdopterin-guanine dinucleotide biosynthesis protein A
MCGLQHEHLRWIVEQGDRASAIALYLRRAASPDGIEPLPLYLRRAAVPLIDQTLAAGRRAVRSFLSQPGILAIDTPLHWPDSVWTNLNTPDDLIRAERVRGYTH